MSTLALPAEVSKKTPQKKTKQKNYLLHEGREGLSFYHTGFIFMPMHNNCFPLIGFLQLSCEIAPIESNDIEVYVRDNIYFSVETELSPYAFKAN